jgi:hypothetical protein
MPIGSAFAPEIFVATPIFGEPTEFKAAPLSDSLASAGYSYYTEIAGSPHRHHELTRRRPLTPPDRMRTSDRYTPLKGFYERAPEDVPFHPLSPRFSSFGYGPAGNQGVFMDENEVLEVLLGPSHYNRIVSGLWTHYASRPQGLQERVCFDYAFGVYQDKAILPQIGSYACTAACSAMLILDHGRKPNLTALFERVSGDTDLIVQDLDRAHLAAAMYTTPEGEKVDPSVLEVLIKRGPLIVFLDTNPGSHAVVLDEFDPRLNRATLRDPFHGWMVRTTAHAISRRFLGHAVYLREG